MKRIILSGLVILSLAFISGCNTVEGFGKDMKKVGQSVENAAERKTNN